MILIQDEIIAKIDYTSRIALIRSTYCMQLDAIMFKHQGSRRLIKSF